MTESLAIEREEAERAGSLGFICRALTQATLPHRPVVGNEFTRTNGNFTLSILSPSVIGLPYGVIPRLLMAWVTSEAVRTRSQELELGPSLSQFMRALGLVPTGGRWGSITRLRDQMVRLFASSVTCLYEDPQRTGLYGVKMVTEAHLWWDPKAPDQIPLWTSTLKLGAEFYQEIVTHPVPIDLEALRALKRSPMALDIYGWLTYRMTYLRAPTEIPWQALEMQFGADYARTLDFRINFVKQLKAVLGVYPEARVEEGARGLLLKPSPRHGQLPEPAGSRRLSPAPSTPAPLRASVQAVLKSLVEVSGETLPQAKTPTATPPAPRPVTETPRLAVATYEKAKQAAPGLDVYVLEQEWRQWIAKKGFPNQPDVAFVGFCRKRFQKQNRARPPS